MSVLIRDTGFTAEDWPHGFTPSRREITGENGAGLDLPGDIDPADLVESLHGLGMIRIAFASFADGRGFTLARQLRLMGYKGRLRASGPLLADQYTMARRCGFDEVEISTDHAKRQPEPSWLFRADWRINDYQAQMRGEGIASA
ncbi:DUF934 domain-containing protein [Aquicoccus sp. G2-2]|uniref:DUF934 domain-containing protein n=1 Tax=Aquicoccus sp. G2-2 TaxID=3092120 RepID=UPI002ADF7FD0|nr:DUF934 domain-containing protein [Aquicoccus sp. G2-2]MEA1115267.1 DUF934 domain-containing protein [Aquicoccus sp. G2-2]